MYNSACQLCRAKLRIDYTKAKPRNYVAHLEQIISRCSKHLSKNVFQDMDWDIQSEGDQFCEECTDNTQKLLQLDITLEQVNKEIKELVNSISVKIENEKQQNECQSNHNSQLELESVADIYLSPTKDDPRDASISSEFDTIHSTFDDWDVTTSSNLSFDLFDTHSLSLDEVQIQEAPVFQNKTGLGHDVKMQQYTESQINQKNINCTKGNLTAPENGNQNAKVEDGYVCTKCNKKFSRLSIFKSHKCDTETECRTCGKSFSSHGSLQLHQLTHTGTKKHKCDICGKSFKLTHHLKLHIKTHSVQRYKCDLCEKEFKDKGYLERHKVQHTTSLEERRKFACEYCSKKFIRKTTLKFHLVQHTQISKFKCKVCLKHFSRAAVLLKHELTHTKEKRFKCHACYKTFTSQSARNSHALLHNEEKTYQCDQCEKSYSLRSSLMAHISSKHNIEEGDFICHECGKYFPTQIKLRNHIRNHEYRNKVLKQNQKFSCVVCQRSFGEEGNLYNHQKLNHRVEILKQYPCNKCQKIYHDYKDFTNHMKIRGISDDATFRLKCHICTDNIIFPSRCTMVCHYDEKHAEAEYPYRCSKCGCGFLGVKDLRRHKEECMPETFAILENKCLKEKERQARKRQLKNGTGDKEENFPKILSSPTVPRRSERVSTKTVYIKQEPEGESDVDSANNNDDQDSKGFDSESDVDTEDESDEESGESVIQIKTEPESESDYNSD